MTSAASAALAAAMNAATASASWSQIPNPSAPSAPTENTNTSLTPPFDPTSVLTDAPIPRLPDPSPLFDTYEECNKFVMDFAYKNGFGLSRSGGSNKRLINGVPTHASVRHYCDLGRVRESRARGLRDKRTTKLGCPYVVNVKCMKINGNKWCYDEKLAHSHGKTKDPSVHRCFRDRTTSQQETLRALAKMPGAKPRDIEKILQAADPSRRHFTRRDVYNDLAKYRKDQEAGMTPQQAFVKHLRDQGAEVREGKLDESGKMHALFWTWP